MANMSYCRFENTVPDLRDCYENMDEQQLSETEARARKWLIRLCQKVVDDYGYEVTEE